MHKTLLKEIESIRMHLIRVPQNMVKKNKKEK
jgi:hypothetical protein